MRLVATPEQEQLREAVAEFCRREMTVERLRVWERGTDADEILLREQIARLGWIGLGVPSSAGGSGASLTDVAVLVAECARGLLSRSLIGAIEGATMLAALAPAEPALAAVASGDNRVAIAVEEEGVRSAQAVGSRLESGPDGMRVRGRKAYVPHAEEAELHLLVVRDGEELACVLVDASADRVSTTDLASFGGDRQAHVVYDDAPVLRRIGGAEAVQRLDRTRRALALAQMIGGMEAVVEGAVAYVQERDQFGQKIALFQAVRHQIADIGIRIAASRHLSWEAITRIDRDLLQGHELEAALAYVGRSFREACFTGHHLHGGAGFVLEHPLHFHSERAQSLAIRYAPEGPALAAIASELLD